MRRQPKNTFFCNCNQRYIHVICLCRFNHFTHYWKCFQGGQNLKLLYEKKFKHWWSAITSKRTIASHVHALNTTPIIGWSSAVDWNKITLNNTENKSRCRFRFLFKMNMLSFTFYIIIYNNMYIEINENPHNMTVSMAHCMFFFYLVAFEIMELIT